MKINRQDFLMALDEVHPAFGVSEEELQQVVANGIVHYDDNIEVSLRLHIGDNSANDVIRHRTSSKTESSMWSKSVTRSGRLSSAYSSTVPVVQARRLWQRPWLSLPNSRSSSSFHQIPWSALTSIKKLRISTRSLATATRAPARSLLWTTLSGFLVRCILRTV